MIKNFGVIENFVFSFIDVFEAAVDTTVASVSQSSFLEKLFSQVCSTPMKKNGINRFSSSDRRSRQNHCRHDFTTVRQEENDTSEGKNYYTENVLWFLQTKTCQYVGSRRMNGLGVKTKFQKSRRVDTRHFSLSHRISKFAHYAMWGIVEHAS